MDDNLEEWVESMGVVSGRDYQEVGVASGWNLWVWLVSVVRRYIIDILIIIITFPYCTCISSFLGSIIPISLFIKKNHSIYTFRAFARSFALTRIAAQVTTRFTSTARAIVLRNVGCRRL